jgi:predicted outer membrane repeat protein
MVINSTFTNNAAVIAGGAVYLAAYNGQGLFSTSNTIYFNSSIFDSNSAGNGGAIGIFYQNVVALNKITLLNNTAVSYGGGMDLDTENTATIENIVFKNNAVVGAGGAFSSKLRNIIVLNSSRAENNSAGISGGAYILKNDTDISFIGENVIEGNKALLGGGIFLFSMKIWNMLDRKSNKTNLQFIANTASDGSAIAMALLKQDSEWTDERLNSIIFDRNFAFKAGTVMWFCDDIVPNEPAQCIEPYGLRDSGLIWVNNSAAYGERYATQVTTIVTDDHYNVTEYNSILKPGKSSIHTIGSFIFSSI